MKFTDLLNKDHYRSIIALLSFYQIHRDKKGKVIGFEKLNFFAHPKATLKTLPVEVLVT